MSRFFLKTVEEIEEHRWGLFFFADLQACLSKQHRVPHISVATALHCTALR